jgi:2-methylcitrate dehydratase PrpD
MVRSSEATREHAGWPYKPQGMTAAQLNMSFCLATLLIEGDCFVDQFAETMLADPERLALAAKVEVREDPAISALGSKFRHMVHVAVHLADGTVLEETVEAPRGSERNFPSAEDVVAKFSKLVSRRLAPAHAKRIADMVLNLDKLTSLDELIGALALA